eukprot:COSAG01_NODE_11342_length_1954_cov_2.388679_1_plen_79_part_00
MNVGPRPKNLGFTHGCLLQRLPTRGHLSPIIPDPIKLTLLLLHVVLPLLRCHHLLLHLELQSGGAPADIIETLLRRRG